MDRQIDRRPYVCPDDRSKNNMSPNLEGGRHNDKVLHRNVVFHLKMRPYTDLFSSKVLEFFSNTSDEPNLFVQHFFKLLKMKRDVPQQQTKN